MLEFVFFHPTPQQLFIDWLKGKKLQPEVHVEDEVYTVMLPEEIDDALYDAIEEKYEELLEMNEEIMITENADEEGYHHMAGISVQLKDGRTSYADIDPKRRGRGRACISPEAFATIVDAIVTAVENPQERTYCQRQREAEAV